MNKIVIAEASATIRSVADSLLRQNGYGVICVSDGLQAWEIIQSEKPDLVLTGVTLSGLTGLELCKQVARDQITGGIPVVVMVGSKDPITGEDILSCGARGQLKKPFSPKELLEIVDKMTHRKVKDLEETDITEGHEKTKAALNPEVFLMPPNPGTPGSSSYTLDWSVLNDVSTKALSLEEKNAAAGEEHGLEISDDQYGLMSSPEEIEEEMLAAARQTKREEDFSWFMDEIKKEITGESDAGSLRQERAQIAPAATKEEAVRQSPPSQSYTEFEELLAGFNEISKPVQQISVAEKSPAKNSFEQIGIGNYPPSDQANQGGYAKSLSESEIDLIADRVAIKLASLIIEKIDKKQIIDAIRSELK